MLVGSVNGQRFWSQLYDLANNMITAATWTPNDEFIVFGLSNGSFMIVDDNGTVVNRLNVEKINGDSILALAYSSPKFFIDEYIEAVNKRHQSTKSHNKKTNNGSNVLSSNENETQMQSNETNFNNQSATTVAAAADLINLSIINQNRLRFSLNNFYFSNNANNNRYESKLKNKVNNNNYFLACSTKSSGIIYLIKNFDPPMEIIVIDTELKGNNMFETLLH